MTATPELKPSAVMLRQYGEWKAKFIEQFQKVTQFTYRDGYKELQTAFYDFLNAVNEKAREQYADIQLDEAEAALTLEETAEETTEEAATPEETEAKGILGT